MTIYVGFRNLREPYYFYKKVLKDICIRIPFLCNDVIVEQWLLLHYTVEYVININRGKTWLETFPSI
jgi:hypothetical protein